MMTLDEAIQRERHAMRQTAGERSEEHRQLAEWLRELQALKAENEQYRELIRILDHDWNIEASWDGLRKFWYVGLTEKGVAERDKREAENEKLRELARKNWFIALSERDALRIYGVDPVEENYFTVLDKEMSKSRATMQELGIEVD
jgi:hypothetical protein